MTSLTLWLMARLDLTWLRLARLDLASEDLQPLQPPVLLIDAYNIINQDATMKAFMRQQVGGSAREGPAFARAELERRVQRYAEAAGVNCTIVYDALGRWRGGRVDNTVERLDERVDVVFSATKEADSFIVQQAQLLKVAASNPDEMGLGKESADLVSARLELQMRLGQLHSPKAMEARLREMEARLREILEFGAQFWAASATGSQAAEVRGRMAVDCR